jgi:hypothetical protein
MRYARIIAVLAVLPGVLTAVQLKPAASAAFDDYCRRVESRLEGEVNGPAFLWADQVEERRNRVRGGEIVAEPLGGKNATLVPGGLIHDWAGAVFIPGTTVHKVLALVENYNHHQEVYRPEVVISKLVSRSDNDFKIYLRLLKKKVITVVLDSYYDVHYVRVNDTRWYSRSYSTRIQEVENAGKPNEHVLAPGNDHGFLWRLNSYWRFEERDGGVYMECEAVSLTRDIPAGLGWLLEPIIRQLPRESLVETLRKTREALKE